MAEQPENLILRHLQDIRSDIGELRVEVGEVRAQIGVLSQGQIGMRNQIKELSGKFDSMTTHVHEIAIAVDHHSTRLDGIEHHLGLDAAKH